MVMLNVRRFCLLFIATAGLGGVLSWDSLNYPWYWDDYHLVRVYSLPELREAFSGHWDVDNVETASYRPLTTMLNHVRAFAFGENVFAHRLFGVAMFAAFVSLACYVLSQLGLRLLYAIAAGVLIVAATSNTPNLIWISDTAHPVSGIPVAAAALIACGPAFAWRQRIATFVLGFTSLLVREDIAAMFPFIVLVALLAENRRLLPSSHRLGPRLETSARLAIGRTVEATIGLGIAAAIYTTLRILFVPNAATGFNVYGFVNHVFWTLSPAGMPPLLPEPIFKATSLISAIVVATAFSLGNGSSGRALAAILLVCMVIGCTPGLVTERSNLLLVPTTMFALFLALCMQIVVCAFSRPLASISVAIVLIGLWIGLVATAFHQSRMAQEGVHPFSLEIVRATNDMVYGGSHRAGARLSEAKLAFGKSYLAQFGINSAEDFETRYALLERQVKTERRLRPDGEKVFLPGSGSIALLGNYPNVVSAK